MRLAKEGTEVKSIGYVLADFPVLSETFVGDEMRAMARRGHKITPIVSNLRQGPAQEADRKLAKSATLLSSASNRSALKALVRPSARFPLAIAYLIRQKRQPRLSLMWNALKLAAIARDEGCEHLHAHFAGGATAHAIVAAHWIGASVSFVCHGHDVYAEPEDLPVKLAAADAAVAVCNDMAADLHELAPRAAIAIIPCGTDHSAFKPARDREQTARLLFIGRLIPCKGIDDLLSALAIQGTASVDIVGDGPLEQKLRERAEALGVAERVNFLGARSREWIVENGPGYLGLVAPFKQGPDGTKDTGPLVIKEAMAMELPVIGTRQMGIKEMVSPETGFLVEPADPSSLANAIDAFLQLTPAERRTMGQKGRERLINRFSLDASSKALSNLFEAI